MDDVKVGERWGTIVGNGLGYWTGNGTVVKIGDDMVHWLPDAHKGGRCNHTAQEGPCIFSSPDGSGVWGIRSFLNDFYPIPTAPKGVTFDE